MKMTGGTNLMQQLWFIIINICTCLGHLYAHLQEYRLYVTAYGVQHSWRCAYRCPKHVEIFLIIKYNCCIKLVPLVIVTVSSLELSVIPRVIRDPMSYPWSQELSTIRNVDVNTAVESSQTGGFLALSRKTCIKGTDIHLVCGFRTWFRMGSGALGRRMLNTITHFWNYIMNSVSF